MLAARVTKHTHREADMRPDPPRIALGGGKRLPLPSPHSTAQATVKRNYSAAIDVGTPGLRGILLYDAASRNVYNSTIPSTRGTSQSSTNTRVKGSAAA